MADFAFTRLQYDSGDWDVDQRMPSNLLNSLIEYTTLGFEFMRFDCFRSARDLTTIRLDSRIRLKSQHQVLGHLLCAYWAIGLKRCFAPSGCVAHIACHPNIG